MIWRLSSSQQAVAPVLIRIEAMEQQLSEQLDRLALPTGGQGACWTLMLWVGSVVAASAIAAVVTLLALC